MKWIRCEEQMPEEHKYESDNMQGHHEWTESGRVLVWDSLYGPGIDSTRNGKWIVGTTWRVSTSSYTWNTCLNAKT